MVREVVVDVDGVLGPHDEVDLCIVRDGPGRLQVTVEHGRFLARFEPCALFAAALHRSDGDGVDRLTRRPQRACEGERKDDPDHCGRRLPTAPQRQAQRHPEGADRGTDQQHATEAGDHQHGGAHLCHAQHRQRYAAEGRVHVEPLEEQDRGRQYEESTVVGRHEHPGDRDHQAPAEHHTEGVADGGQSPHPQSRWSEPADPDHPTDQEPHPPVLTVEQVQPQGDACGCEGPPAPRRHGEAHEQAGH